MVGSLLGWKSLETKRRTRELCRQQAWLVVVELLAQGGEWRWVYLSYCGFTEQHKFDAAAGLGCACCCVGHGGR